MGGGMASPAARRSRPIGPGGRPSSSESAFSTMAICCSIVGNRGGGPRPVGLDAIELEPVRHAAVQPVLEVGDRLVVEAKRLPRDLELQIELAQQEVVGRDVADQRDEHAAAALLAGEHERQRRFVLTPQAAEQIELPGQLEAVGAALVRRVFARSIPSCCGRFDACRSAVVGDAVDLRIEKRLRDAGAGARLLDARDRDAQIEVVGDAPPG